MSKEKQNFWIRCPQCKHSFGVKPEVVFKYLDRVQQSASARLVKLTEELATLAKRKVSEATKEEA